MSKLEAERGKVVRILISVVRNFCLMEPEPNGEKSLKTADFSAPQERKNRVLLGILTGFANCSRKL